MVFRKMHDIAEGMNQMLEIKSVVSGKTVRFPAFIENFSDSFNVGWNQEETFGRIDPVLSYRSTTRQISLGISVLAPNKNKGIENLLEYSKLIQMLYPSYSQPLNEGSSLGRTITAPPIMKVRLMNYIQSADGTDGLYGAIQGLKFNPDFNMGHFVRNDGTLIPKKFTIDFSFVPQHSSEIGSNDHGQFLSSTFPYGETQPGSDMGSADSPTNPNSGAAADQALGMSNGE